MKVKELSDLPLPQIIEALDYEKILAALKSDFKARWPDYSAFLESDPAIKLLEVAAYRELLLRARVNDAARANLLAFAGGSDLDHLASFYGVFRMVIQEEDLATRPITPRIMEDDTSLRLRTRARIIGFACAGGAAHYRYWALSASPEVADVAVDSPAPGQVRVSVLATGDRENVPPEVLDAVSAVIMRDDVRVLTDTVVVVPAEILHVNVQARIWLYPDAPIEIIDAIAHEFPRRLLASAGLGWDLTQSWIISELHKDGVHKVELSSPTASIRALAHQAVRLTSINLEFAGRDR